ncbi:histidine phosphatase family protein [Streptococcus marimammalium]|uniref:histidine phosphatase family protein n=1 Tax=Streptococcus marimammalium TaxID=269666 RepID=UPI00037C8CF6|nr:histidine phosphatase family protein [Streptococcus marimammalium]
MGKINLYIARHGKTMFNTLGRAQGWSDTPLTETGIEGIRELGAGLKASGISFKEAFSSDSGRTLETMSIILEELDQKFLPYTRDKRIREWCFGSLDGAYDGELFYGILPRTDAFKDGRSLKDISYEELAQSIVEVDTANWAEPWEILSKRIIDGFTAIAKKLEKQGGGNAIVVCHGLTIGTLLWLIDHQQEKTEIDNGSITVVSYENDRFTIEKVADMCYRHKGKELRAKNGKETS